jgi:hypothetical protein
MSEDKKTYRYKNCAPKETVPGIIWIVVMTMIEKDGPLIAWNHKIATAQLFLDSTAG